MKICVPNLSMKWLKTQQSARLLYAEMHVGKKNIMSLERHKRSKAMVLWWDRSWVNVYRTSEIHTWMVVIMMRVSTDTFTELTRWSPAFNCAMHVMFVAREWQLHKVKKKKAWHGNCNPGPHHTSELLYSAHCSNTKIHIMQIIFSHVRVSDYVNFTNSSLQFTHLS